MLNFLAENWGTLLIGAIVLAIVLLILFSMQRNRKKGTNSCGGGCENCPSCGMCHKK